MTRIICAAIVCLLITAGKVWAAPLYEAEFVFDPEKENHGHVHASCIVECPNGDLRAVWYENGTPMPAPYFSEQRDKSDDVRIGGGRKASGAAAWDPPFVMSDTFGVSDNNPCMVIDQEQRLWLVHPTLLGVPGKTWGSALLQYKVSSDYERPGVPRWDKERFLVPHPTGVEAAMRNAAEKFTQSGKIPKERIDAMLQEMAEQMKDPLTLRLGWMSRAHPLVLSDGTVMFPLANENYDIAVMFYTKDGGDTWTCSEPVPEAGITQPTVVQLSDQELVAFFRNSGPERRIKRSESKDGGRTWSPLSITDLLHPGAGIEAALLKNGHLAMVYNDKEESPRDKLAVSISDDQGKTWKWTHHLENTPQQRFDYPSLIQGKDETLHASYSDNLKTIKHVHFNEEWVQQGDQ
ncbi:MAG: exo-alpha-sialidase [Candidatus Hydrogenedentes bacterium]|nr:exo-alpha-sialidase [Candidatus Hydrogenedentota bacterium]